MKHKQNLQEKVTFIDRISVAFLSAVLSFVTGLVVWFLAVAALSFEGPYIFSSFKLVIGFTIIMTLAGFLMLQNIVANLLGYMLHAIVNYIKH